MSRDAGSEPEEIEEASSAIRYQIFAECDGFELEELTIERLRWVCLRWRYLKAIRDLRRGLLVCA